MTVFHVFCEQRTFNANAWSLCWTILEMKAESIGEFGTWTLRLRPHAVGIAYRLIREPMRHVTVFEHRGTQHDRLP